MEDSSIMTFRISPDDLKPGTWITIRRSEMDAPKTSDPELRCVQQFLERLRRPSGPLPGLPLQVTVVGLPFVYVRPLDLSGLPEKMEIVDLDEHVVVGCDLEMVKRIETEVYKARCRRHAYADQMKKRLESREPAGDERQSDLDLIEPHPRDEVERKENLDFLDDLAA